MYYQRLIEKEIETVYDSQQLFQEINPQKAIMK